MSDYLSHVRSLEELHRAINDVGEPSAHGAAARLVTEVEDAVAVIVKNTENIVSGIHAEAEAVGEKITAEAAATVAEIRKKTVNSATRLLRDVETGGDEKSAARAAGRILTEATLSSRELNQQSEEAVTLIAEKMESEVTKIQRVIKDTIGEITEMAKNAIRKVAEKGKQAAALPPASETDGDQSKAKQKEMRQAAAEDINSLAQVAEKVNRAAMKATAKLQKVAEDVIKMLEQAARNATSSVERAIDDANKKILKVTESAILDTVGAEEAEYFDLDALTQKWRKKDG